MEAVTAFTVRAIDLAISQVETAMERYESGEDKEIGEEEYQRLVLRYEALKSKGAIAPPRGHPLKYKALITLTSGATMESLSSISPKTATVEDVEEFKLMGITIEEGALLYRITSNGPVSQSWEIS